jgi:tetratricopeptide (TPR) repeat protein
MESSKVIGRTLIAGIVLFLSLTGARVRADVPVKPASIPDPLRVALDHFYNLEYDPAEKELHGWLQKHPDDLRAWNYLATTILQRELLRQELLEAQVFGKGGEAYRGEKRELSPELRRKLFGTLDKVEQLAEERLNKNPRDAEALYWAGVGHVTRALINLTLMRARMEALGEAKKARKLHAQVLSIDPRFVDAYLVIGMYDYIVGSLAWYVKVFATLVGHSGNKERGLAEVKRVSEEGNWAHEDAKSYLAILYYREKRYDEALKILRGLARSYPRNYIVQQEIARVHKAREDWKAAAEAYDAIVARHDTGASGYGVIPLAKILFQAGEVWGNQGSPEQALLRYERAGKLDDNNIYVFRSELAAADTCVQLNRRGEALRKYQRVAAAIPNTGEGKAARQALKKLGKKAG